MHVLILKSIAYFKLGSLFLLSDRARIVIVVQALAISGGVVIFRREIFLFFDLLINRPTYFRICR